jgi:uncharacterized BrkB/YihY/UPF0761 family membrane protein
LVAVPLVVQDVVPPLAVTHAVLKKYGEDRGGVLAGLLAFRGFVSMFPLLLATPSIGASTKVRTEHIRAIDKSRLSGYITDIGADDLQEINRALCKVLAIKPPSLENRN